jgi:hypothetical protein
MGAFRPGGPGSGAATDGSGDINIVELNLYGVASLFEKPGAPPIVPAEGANPEAPSAPKPKPAPKNERPEP